MFVETTDRFAVFNYTVRRKVFQGASHKLDYDTHELTLCPICFFLLDAIPRLYYHQTANAFAFFVSRKF